MTAPRALTRYRLRFHGRRIGALGIGSDVVLYVWAVTPEEAAREAYESHEHISGGLDGVRVEVGCSEGPVQ